MALHGSVNDAIDSSRLTRRYWGFGTVIAVTTMFEYFDLFLIGYVMSLVGPEWGLSFGESSLVLVASGVGAVCGALVAGHAGDRFGRKPTLVTTLLIVTIATGSMALVPDGSWQILAVLRFIAGAAVPALHLAAITLVVELTPTCRRTTLSSLIAIGFVPLGGMIAAIVATWTGTIGWRGLVLAGWAALLLLPLLVLLVPESPRWLASNGERDRAEKVLRRFTDDPNSTLPATSETALPQKAPVSALFKEPRLLLLLGLTWFGVSTVSYAIVLWGPTMLSLVLDLSPSEAAKLFIFVSFGGVVGRISTSFAAGKFGRRPTGILVAFCSAAACILVALFKEQELAGVAIFFPMLIIVYLFADGAWANAGPMSAELFPTSLRSRAGAYTQVINGMGKIVGPMILGIIAGTGNVVSPKATIPALTPAFYCLAAFSVLVGLSFLLVKVETNGRSLEDLSEKTTLPGSTWQTSKI